MVYVLGRLKVENYDKWIPVFDERSAYTKKSVLKKLMSSLILIQQ